MAGYFANKDAHNNMNIIFTDIVWSLTPCTYLPTLGCSIPALLLLVLSAPQSSSNSAPPSPCVCLNWE